MLPIRHSIRLRADQVVMLLRSQRIPLPSTFVPKRRISDMSTKRGERPRRHVTALRLPVPRLRDTLDRYLQSLEPFLLEEEARGGCSFNDGIRARMKAADVFERGLGRTLQQRLVGRSVESSSFLLHLVRYSDILTGRTGQEVSI